VCLIIIFCYIHFGCTYAYFAETFTNVGSICLQIKSILFHDEIHTLCIVCVTAEMTYGGLHLMRQELSATESKYNQWLLVSISASISWVRHEVGLRAMFWKTCKISKEWLVLWVIELIVTLQQSLFTVKDGTSTYTKANDDTRPIQSTDVIAHLPFSYKLWEQKRPRRHYYMYTSFSLKDCVRIQNQRAISTWVNLGITGRLWSAFWESNSIRLLENCTSHKQVVVQLSYRHPQRVLMY